MPLVLCRLATSTSRHLSALSGRTRARARRQRRGATEARRSDARCAARAPRTRRRRRGVARRGTPPPGADRTGHCLQPACRHPPRLCTPPSPNTLNARRRKLHLRGEHVLRAHTNPIRRAGFTAEMVFGARLLLSGSRCLHIRRRRHCRVLAEGYPPTNTPPLSADARPVKPTRRLHSRDGPSTFSYSAFGKKMAQV
jgi:hypothetical protein